jgi:hypothetical protein
MLSCLSENFSPKCCRLVLQYFQRRHDNQHNDTQHNDIQHSDTQHKGHICDNQHKQYLA